MSKFSNISIPTNRFTAMLQMIPRAPDSISTERLYERLSAVGFKNFGLRDVQRDLRKLVESDEFGLSSEKRGKESARWQYLADAPVTIFPSLDDHTALAFRLADAFLQSLMPPETVRALRPFVEEAGKHLSKRRQSAAGKWQDKIHVFPQGMRKRAPSINPAVRETVYRAILEEKPLRLIHKSRGKKETNDLVVSPVGLVIRDYMIYLYGWHHERNKVYTFALNRMQSADILEDEHFWRPPASFFLAENEDMVSMRIDGSPRLDLKLRIGSISTFSLKECPLVGKKTRTSEPGKQKGGKLTAEVPNTVELRQWIRSLGPNAEVLEPTFLRHEIGSEIATLAQRYGCLTTPTV